MDLIYLLYIPNLMNPIFIRAVFVKITLYGFLRFYAFSVSLTQVEIAASSMSIEPVSTFN